MSQFMESYRNANIQELSRQLTNMTAQLDVEKKTAEELDRIKKARQDRNWWDAPIETLSIDQLEKLKVGMLELKKNSEMQAERLMAEAANTTTPIIPRFGSAGVDGAGPST
ncbi:hypothetical protein L6452_11739 [Arctium lappa]|nr:hypothetical protein L6452_11739 [Arctium lappa]